MEAPRWTPGEVYEVSITVGEVREPSPDCPSPTTVTIRETVPPGWTPSSPSHGGIIAGETITWTLSGAAIQPGTVLTYRVTAGGLPANVRFTGTIDDAFVPSPFRTSGPSLVHNPSGFSSGCFIGEWLLLGPYRQPFGNPAAPGIDSMRADWLTDGAGLDEATIVPREGDVVRTAYGPAGPARSIGLEPTSNPDLNPGGLPTWYSWIDADDTIDFASVCRGDEDAVLFHALAYIHLEADRTVDIGLASDDSIQVLLDGEEIWINSVARPLGPAGGIQDVIRAASTPALSPLRAGRHRLLVKVFEGAGEHGFRLRLQDPITGEGICEGVTVCLDPDPVACGLPPPVPYLRGD
ncbi:MAG TPA: hypothetical protein VFV36_08085, partial [Candidatus Methylomirabilis sp.]|nr:hypothetical protein [Candidatus Methylomirabilis sp.]